MPEKGLLSNLHRVTPMRSDITIIEIVRGARPAETQIPRSTKGSRNLGITDDKRPLMGRSKRVWSAQKTVQLRPPSRGW